MAWPEVTAVESEFRFSGGNGRVGNGHLSAHSEFFSISKPDTSMILFPQIPPGQPKSSLEDCHT